MRHAGASYVFTALAICMISPRGSSAVAGASGNSSDAGADTASSGYIEPLRESTTWPRHLQEWLQPGATAPLSGADLERLETDLLETHPPVPIPWEAPAGLLPEWIAPTDVSGPQETSALDPGALAIFRDTPLGAAAVNSSTVNEPSVAQSDGVVMMTGNWYGALSTDGGRSFRFVSPFPGPFPAPAGSPGFCCDQNAIHHPGTNTILWLQLFRRDVAGGGSNTHRINVDMGSDGTFDCAYDITPQSFGQPLGYWMDFPDLVLGANFVYHTASMLYGSNPATNRGYVVARYPLAQISSCTALTFDFFLTSDRQSPRATHGAGTTMYWASHTSNRAIRIRRWDEGSGFVYYTDRQITAWNNIRPYYCPGPDGRDMCARADGRILGSSVANGVLTFMWNAGPQFGSLPYPHVRIARFREDTRSLIHESVIWNPDFAWLYPSVGVNSRDHLGGTVLFGGGTKHPGCAAWISDDVNGEVLGPLENVVIETSTAGPERNNSGDYLSTRPHSPYDTTWVGTCFGVSSNGKRGEPRYAWFGRERDAGNRVPVADAGLDDMVECTSHAGATVALDGSGSSDPDGDPVSCHWTSSTCAFAAAGACSTEATCPLGENAARLEASDEFGAVDEDSVSITVVDTRPPDTACPSTTAIECDESIDPSATGMAGATDVCDPGPGIGWTEAVVPGTCPQESTIARTWTATDVSGNSADCTQMIEVADTTPPDLTVVLTPDVLWPPDGKLRTVDAGISVVDTCDASPETKLLAVDSSEPDDGTGDGSNIDDIQGADLGTDDREFRLRAERQGSGVGRIYNVTYEASDACGNVTQLVSEVRVPHDQSGHVLAWCEFTPDGRGPVRRLELKRTMPADQRTSGSHDIQ